MIRTPRTPAGIPSESEYEFGLAWDGVRTPDGFEWSTIIAWGDPILADAPDFDFENQSAAAQEGQFGYNNDYTTLIRGRDENHATLVCNNEYTNDELMFRGYAGAASLAPEQLRITMAAHGMSVVALRRRSSVAPYELPRIGSSTLFASSGFSGRQSMSKMSA